MYVYHKPPNLLHRLTRQRPRRALARRLALPLAFCFSGTFILAPVAQGLTLPLRTPKPAGHVRKLTDGEMKAITGAQHTLTKSAAAGDSYAWEGSTPVAPAGKLNTTNGNLKTAIPIVGWTARGGLPVNLTLYHNSEGNHDDELGQHWTHSYDIYLLVYSDEAGHSDGDVCLHWGDDLS